MLDEWFEFEVRPRLTGRCTLIRFADDAVLAFEDFLDAKRVLGVLGKRLMFERQGEITPPCGECDPTDD
jgi:RNA-directed DNA polymerase